MAERGTYVWNEAKRRANIAKHGVDFTAAYALDWDAALTIDHTRAPQRRDT